jgi:hypothetical protein
VDLTLFGKGGGIFLSPCPFYQNYTNSLEVKDDINRVILAPCTDGEPCKSCL